MVPSKKIIFCVLLAACFLISKQSSAQTFKYWVKFTNKTGTPYTVSNPSAFLSAKSIQRRTNQNIVVDQTDLPVTPSYVTQVDAVSGVTVLYRSKWLNGVVVQCPTTSTAAISSLSFVASTGSVNKYKITLPYVENIEYLETLSGKAAGTTTYNYANSNWQQKMLDVECLHDLGFRGQNMVIAVIDDGFRDVHLSPIYDSLFLQNRLLGTRDFVTGDTMVFEDDAHGAMVLSTMAGLMPGKIIGTAPKAKYWLLRSEDIGSETLSEEYNWIRAAEFADSVGADITTTSLGYTLFDGGLNNHSYSTLDGKTAPMSIASTMAARKGMLVLNAAGNEGGGAWQFVSVPADADSIITVGAVDSLSNVAGFSSTGPTADGRIKPDLVARGSKAYVCASWPSCFYGNGTSFACPILAGATACLWQSKYWAKNMQIIQALKSSATNSAIPNNSIGWGVPKMCKAYTDSIFSVVAKELAAGNSLSIFPNPFGESITVELKQNISYPLTVSICDILGKEVRSQKINPKGQSVQINDLSTLPQGFYIIIVSSPEFKVSKKMLKQ